MDVLSILAERIFYIMFVYTYIVYVYRTVSEHGCDENDVNAQQQQRGRVPTTGIALVTVANHSEWWKARGRTDERHPLFYIINTTTANPRRTTDLVRTTSA